jgi:hypothetical protein
MTITDKNIQKLPLDLVFFERVFFENDARAGRTAILPRAE